MKKKISAEIKEEENSKQVSLKDIESVLNTKPNDQAASSEKEIRTPGKNDAERTDARNIPIKQDKASAGKPGRADRAIAGSRRKKRRAKQNKTVSMVTLAMIILFFVALVYAGVDYVIKANKPKVYSEFKNPGEVMENETFSFTVTKAEQITEISHYEMDENYVYVLIGYSFTNKTEEAIAWENFPYYFVSELTEYKNAKTGEALGGYVIAEGVSPAEYDVNALRYYGLENSLIFSDIMEDLAPGATKEDTDIVKIPKSSFDTNRDFVIIDLFNTPVRITPAPVETETETNAS